VDNEHGRGPEGGQIMKHQEGFFNGVRNHQIYYQYWLPETEPKAVLLVVHGLAEHGGRYVNLVNHFLPLGYAGLKAYGPTWNGSRIIRIHSHRSGR
jgi:hypothetical protein